MTSIKIWECDPPEITEIVFSKDELMYLEPSSDPAMIRICDKDEDESNYTLVYKQDIPNLIKALEKAQEIWT